MLHHIEIVTNRLINDLIYIAKNNLISLLTTKVIYL